MADEIYISTPQANKGNTTAYPGMVSAPGPFVQDGDGLVLSCTTSDSTGVLRFAARHLKLNGEVQESVQFMTFSGTGTQTEIGLPLSAGWIVGFSVSRVSGTLTDGEVVVSVHLVNNYAGAKVKMACLASGYVTDVRSVGLYCYEYGATAATATTGTVTAVAVANPAAGADWSTTVTAGKYWNVLSITYRFVTSAAVASRTSYLKVTDGATVVGKQWMYVAQAASETLNIGASPGSAYSADNVGTTWYVNTVFSPTWVTAGQVIGTETTNIQAADQYSLIGLQVVEYSL